MVHALMSLSPAGRLSIEYFCTKSNKSFNGAGSSCNFMISLVFMVNSGTYKISTFFRTHQESYPRFFAWVYQEINYMKRMTMTNEANHYRLCQVMIKRSYYYELHDQEGNFRIYRSTLRFTLILCRLSYEQPKVQSVVQSSPWLP